MSMVNEHTYLILLLSMATSTTSAPAAAQASMLAVAIPAVSCECTWMGRSGWAFLMAPIRLKEDASVSPSRQFIAEVHIQFGSLGLEETSHVLDTEDVDTLLHELVNEVEVVLESVLGLVGAGNIAAVADDGLDNTTGLLGGVNSEFHLQSYEESTCDLCIEAHTFSTTVVSIVRPNVKNAHTYRNS